MSNQIRYAGDYVDRPRYAGVYDDATGRFTELPPPSIFDEPIRRHRQSMRLTQAPTRPSDVTSARMEYILGPLLPAQDSRQATGPPPAPTHSLNITSARPEDMARPLFAEPAGASPSRVPTSLDVVADIALRRSFDPQLYLRGAHAELSAELSHLETTSKRRASILKELEEVEEQQAIQAEFTESVKGMTKGQGNAIVGPSKAELYAMACAAREEEIERADAEERAAKGRHRVTGRSSARRCAGRKGKVASTRKTRNTDVHEDDAMDVDPKEPESKRKSKQKRTEEDTEAEFPKPKRQRKDTGAVGRRRSTRNPAASPSTPAKPSRVVILKLPTTPPSRLRQMEAEHTPKAQGRSEDTGGKHNRAEAEDEGKLSESLAAQTGLRRVQNLSPRNPTANLVDSETLITGAKTRKQRRDLAEVLRRSSQR